MDASALGPVRSVLQFDLVLGLVVWASVTFMIAADQAGDRSPDLVAYFWAVGLGGLMLVRRQYPMLVLWITILSLFAYYMGGYPAVGLGVPTMGALLTGAEFLKLRWPVIASVFLIGLSYSARLIQGQDFSLIIGYELTGHLGLMAAAIALGVSLRLRRELQAKSAQLLSAIRDNERSQAQAQITAERLSVARDLHDSLGHQTTVLSMHTDIAREALNENHSETRNALRIIRSTTEDMMAQLRNIVATLRQESPRSHTGSEGTEAIKALPDLFASLPIEVESTVETPNDLPSAIEETLCRIVQEALTNVVKHSAADFAHVKVFTHDRQRHRWLRVEISDPGPRKRSAGTIAGKFGIEGMHERAAALGGNVVGERHHGGFRVRADLPLREDDR